MAPIVSEFPRWMGAHNVTSGPDKTKFSSLDEMMVMANTLVLVLWRRLKYLQCRMFFFGGGDNSSGGIWIRFTLRKSHSPLSLNGEQSFLGSEQRVEQ